MSEKPKQQRSKNPVSITELRQVAAMPSVRSWSNLATRFNLNQKTMENFCRNHGITPYFLKENNDEHRTNTTTNRRADTAQ